MDKLIPHSKDFDDFLSKMRAEGYEIKQGKYLVFRAAGQTRFTRSFRLGDSYTESALREKISTPKHQKITGKKINLLIDIQKKMAAGKGVGYEHWAKSFNLKEAAKTLNFLIENNLTDYDELAARVEKAEAAFNAASSQNKQLEACMAEIAQLKTHIIHYSKTREVYAAYKKSRHKKEFRAEHSGEIAKHEAAKKAFDALNGKPIPKVIQPSQQYAALLEKKRSAWKSSNPHGRT